MHFISSIRVMLSNARANAPFIFERPGATQCRKNLQVGPRDALQLFPQRCVTDAPGHSFSGLRGMPRGAGRMGEGTESVFEVSRYRMLNTQWWAVKR